MAPGERGPGWEGGEQLRKIRRSASLCPPFHQTVCSPQAAARHQCSYLINMHVDEFLKTGGEAEWLSGLELVPQRLRNLSEINKLLAHRPWLVTKEHIQVCVWAPAIQQPRGGFRLQRAPFWPCSALAQQFGEAMPVTT